MVAFRFVVRGRVQGVGYRYFAVREADALGVRGFCKNLPDGSVEVVAEGTEQALRDLEGRLREGPSFAHVEDVESLPVTPAGRLGFHVR